MPENPETRSRTMRAVKSANTAPELAVRKLLHNAGYRFRLHRKDLPGKPDIVFPARKKAVFVHGCFWHGHDCKRGSNKPKSNTAYWAPKIERNMARDRRNIAALAELGWKAFEVWECELKDPERLLKRLAKFLG